MSTIFGMIALEHIRLYFQGGGSGGLLNPTVCSKATECLDVPSGSPPTPEFPVRIVLSPLAGTGLASSQNPSSWRRTVLLPCTILSLKDGTEQLFVGDVIRAIHVDWPVRVQVCKVLMVWEGAGRWQERGEVWGWALQPEAGLLRDSLRSPGILNLNLSLQVLEMREQDVFYFVVC